MSRAGRAAVQVALLGRADPALRPVVRRGRLDSGRQRREDRIEPAATASASPPIIRQYPRSQPPDAAAHADVDVVDAGAAQFGRAPDIVDVVRVAAVDDVSPGCEERASVVDRRVDHAGGHHHPDVARRVELRRRAPASDRRPAMPSAAMAATASGATSCATQSCPARVSRRTMFAPMRPRPIMPSCTGRSFRRRAPHAEGT